ncbi:TRAP-type mannitol/chloroaromatic compound transport system, small permease component [Salinihabitans flavidus]|uniref:TRAP transporter small permease protein n=1 Tax=Salinihabitans flavidus TaxID=569882 RepID=A0A1H8MIA9_9RHOB|nr:TRAP transporter small permease subunit [Salinihabitans flavidus]SEO17047.1 TRAP-type mannitol/chloroaromatic compound transport system, small permease component [Salinihabitans flavidus]
MVKLRSLILALCRWADRATAVLCGTACAVLVASVLAIVVLRFGFDTGFIKLQNLAGYAFAVLMILSLPYCLARGGHVRVEVISERLPAAYIRVADTAALLFLMVPVFGLMIWAYWPDLLYSWSIREGAIETGGLGGVYLVKTALPLAGGLMILQGLGAVLSPEARET